MLELSPLLYTVARYLDGRRSVDDIASVVSAETGRRLSGENVAYLVTEKLNPLRVLRGTPSTEERPAGAPILGLHLRFGVVPKGAVRFIAGLLRPLFVPVVVLLMLVALAATDTWLVLAGRVGASTSQLLYRPGWLLAVAGLTLVGGAFHELGHATASRYGGAQPGAIGAGVYLLWPVFYNDLNDSYRLGRAGRLRADLGGVYFNAVYAVMLFALYGATGYRPLLLVAALQHFVILQQFLPFVRLDGYYVVSDLAGVPDLFGRIRPLLAAVFLGRHATNSGWRDLRPRARSIVTAWILLTVPLLGAGVVFLIISTPHLLTIGAGVVRADWRLLIPAVRSHHVVTATLLAVQLLAVSLPVLGVSSALIRALLRLGSSADARPPGSAPVFGLGALIAILFVVGLGSLAVR
jgi:putative peptide zinc metalloprotease protein